jgi:hypothetical protein
MVKQVIYTGIEGNDATGDPIREAFTKTNSNFNELYAVFGKGDGFPFTALSEYDASGCSGLTGYTGSRGLVPGTMFIVNSAGNKILPKTLEGEGIEIVTTDPNKITLRNSGSRLVYDANPALGGNLNATNFAIGGMRDPILGAQGDANALNVSVNSFATTRGYVGSTFVYKAGDTMTGALNVPAGATGTAVPRRQEVVGRAGDTMTGPLILNADPDDLSDPLTATTKNYVDNNSYSSQVNLFVSTQGDDFRFNLPDRKRGTALSYAFKTINQACFKAIKIIEAAKNELGPYQKPIFYGGSQGRSTLVSLNPTLNYVTMTGASGSGTTITVASTSGLVQGMRVIVSAGTGSFYSTRYDYQGNLVSSDTTVVTVINSTSFTVSRAPKVPLSSATIQAITANTSWLLTITNGGNPNGTDMRGSGNTASLDIRAGHLIRGTTSGATVVVDLIGSINGSVEYYTVHYAPESPVFIVGEELEYGEAVKSPNITIYVESGEYFENLPIRVPNNVSICGDDMRRVLVRPRMGPSCSIWSDTYFRRDHTIDRLTVTQTGNFGYHYLSDSSKSFYSKSFYKPTDVGYNHGNFLNAQKILLANKTFLQDEIIAYINDRITNNVSPYSSSFVYDQSFCRRDVGLIVDAICFDITYGGYTKTLEAAMSYYMNASSIKVLTDQLAQHLDSINHLIFIAKRVIQQIAINPKYSTSTPVTIPGVTAESGVYSVIDNLEIFMDDILNGDSSINMPLDNDQMDMFMLNDSNRIRTLSGQGHGGFMCVLDPAGQILTKSPYIQQCSSFAKSINKQHFAGGVFVDAFTGNLECTITARSYDSGTKLTILTVTGLIYRVPQLPTSFFYQGVRFEIDYIGPPDSPLAGSYKLYLSQSTPDVQSYTGSVTALLSPTVAPAAAKKIEIQTAGNRSMLASDFTQINDMGYGIFVTNNAFFEAVSIFCYYNYRAYYALNGAQIRSLNGSCGYGMYALSAQGSDPTEVPTPVTLRKDMIKVVSTYSGIAFPDVNKAKDLRIYVTIDDPDDVPYTTSQVDIDFSDVTPGLPILSYPIKNATQADASGHPTVYILTISTDGNLNADSLGLAYAIPSSINIILRNSKEFDLLDLKTLKPTRPSNALKFVGDLNVYHILQYIPDGAYNDNISNTHKYAATVDLNETLVYILLQPVTTVTGGTYGRIGDNKIDIQPLDNTPGSQGEANAALLNSGKMIVAWGSKVFGISNYTKYSSTRATITLSDVGDGNTLDKDALSTGYTAVLYLKAGFKAGVGATITTQISLMRATGHDLVDIGTGSFADSNIPANIYGIPVNDKTQGNEVQEIGEGRVFYATTDQDGNVRFGKYFSVNQGTGSVKFAASIGISGLESLQFSHGAEVSEFSIDSAMSRHSSFIVPVESAISDFVSRITGLTYPAYTLHTTQKLGPGFMALNGVTPFGTEAQGEEKTQYLNMNSHQIKTLAGPTSDSDAANKEYVDNVLVNTDTVRTGVLGFTMADSATGVINMNSNKIINVATPTATGDAANYGYVNTKANIGALNDITLSSIDNNQILYYDNNSSGYTGSNAKWRNSLLKNANVATDAAIAQSKLALSDATADATAGAATKGIASFSSANFDSSNGYVSVKVNGLALNRITQIGSGYVLGNKTIATANVAEVTFAEVVNNAISGTDNGLLRRSSTNNFATISYTSDNNANTIVKRDGNGDFAAGDLSVVSVSASGDLSGANVSATSGVSGATVTSTSEMKAGTEIWLNDEKLLDVNGNVTQMFTQNGDKVMSFGGSQGSPTGKFYGTWTLETGATLQATYADLAEYYESDKEYVTGSIMMIGGDKEITLAKGNGTTAVAGVISSNPAYLMNTGCKGLKLAIALQGRVPCRVIGKIQKGDLIVVSSVPGVGTVSTDPKPGSIVGKALANYNSDRVGIIEVLVGKH